MDSNNMSFTSELPSPCNAVHKKNKSSSESVCLPYQKLVVPTKMRSIYWKGFGFPANEKGEILTRQKIVCLFCKTSIAYNRNTSNLRMHLESKHRAKLLEFEANAPPKQKLVKAEKGSYHSVFEIDPSGDQEEHIYESDLSGSVMMQDEASTSSASRHAAQPEHVLVGANTELVEIVVPNIEDQENSMFEGDNATDFIESVVTEFLVTDLISPCVVEGYGFKNLLQCLRPGLQYCSKIKLEDQLLPQCHTALRDSVIEEINGIKHLGLSLEEWKSGSGHEFLTMSAHFLKNSEDVETRVLSSFLLPLDPNQWSPVILDLFLKWGITKEKIIAVTVASKKSDQLIQKLKNSDIKAVPCFTFTLQVAIEKFFNIDSIPEILSKCFSIKDILKDTPILVIDEEQETDSVEEVSIMSQNIWTYTFNLLQKIVIKERDIKELAHTSNITFTSEEWEKIKTIVNILEPFTVILTTLLEEKFSSISLIHPFLCQMINTHLKDNDTDNDFTTLVKLTLREELSNSYIEESVDLLVKLTSFLDPRFKSLPFIQDVNQENVNKELKLLLENIVQENDFSESPVIEKKPKLSGIVLLLGDLCSPKNLTPKSERVQREITQYKLEQSASFDCNPLHWWSATRSKCPNLCQLALHFACVPASSVPSHLLPVHKWSIFSCRRASIDPDNVDTILFLHANQKLFSFQDN